MVGKIGSRREVIAHDPTNDFRHFEKKVLVEESGFFGGQRLKKNKVGIV